MSSVVLADAAARERIRKSLNETLVVEAAAGTGKTTELVARIVSLVRSGQGRLSKLVSVTFTERAAGEMKLRLRAELEKARQAAPPGTEEHERFMRAIQELETAHIGTIHALCTDLLRERPVEAGVDPYFEVAAGEEAEALFDQAFDEWFDATVHRPPEGVRRLLRRRPSSWSSTGPRELLRKAAWDLAEHRDFQTPWQRLSFDRDTRLDALVSDIEAVARDAIHAVDPEDWLSKSLREIAGWVRELTRREGTHGRDRDGLEAELRQLRSKRYWSWKGRGKYLTKGVERAPIVQRRDAAKAKLDEFVSDSDMEIAALLQSDLQPVVAAYADLKARAGRLDFLDLLLRMRDLVRDDQSVREELQGRFTHLLVDEFQDTDPLQAELMMLLAADDPMANDWLSVRAVPGKLFVVGDPKQSIYRFRRADVMLYEAVKERLVRCGAEVVFLTASFRADPAIQEAVNAAFERGMSPQPGSKQARYVRLDPVRAPTTARPAIIALPVPRPFGEHDKITNKATESSFPDAVGAFVEWLVSQSGWTVSERKREAVPLRAAHVCLLFKRFVSYGSDITRPYVAALEARRVPHVLVGGRSWHTREEVLALGTALTAIEWPDDELSVFAALHGPFFALSDEALLAYRGIGGSFHPLRPIGELEGQFSDLTRPVAEALEILKRLHSGRNHRPAADTVSALLDETRAHAGLAIRQTGEQTLANVMQLVDMARRFEQSGPTSFRAFVRRLKRESERGDAGEAPFVEDGADGVRIMTAHKSKGLEFPVVILCDPTAPLAPQDPSRWIDPVKRVWAMPLAGCVPLDLESHRAEILMRDREESVRLSYVAATRARDMLVIPVVGEGRLEGWLETLSPAIYPSDGSRQQPISPPGCPTFGATTVLSKPDDSGGFEQGPVVPGLHVPEAGTHRVTWWDPGALNLDVEPEAGLRHQKLLELDSSGSLFEHRSWEDWRSNRQHTINIARRPSLSVVPATTRAIELAAAKGGDLSVRYEVVEGNRSSRPHGRRFGTLVHAVLASVPLLGDRADVERIAALEGRMLGSSDEEVRAAIGAVSLALEHDLLRAAARGMDVRREAPLMVRDANGTLVEAAVDLAWRDESTWMVVDFKTDEAGAQRHPEYEQQVRVYADGITAATGMPAKPVLLFL